MTKKPLAIPLGLMPVPWRAAGTNKFQETCWAWRRVPVPVIVAVHGHCFGGGIQIALAADFRIATPDSEWSVLEGRWGLIPDMSGVQALSELVGIDTAKRLTMTAAKISGKEAHDLGLVTELAADPVAAAPRTLARGELGHQSRRIASAAARRLFKDRRSGTPVRARRSPASVPSRSDVHVRRERQGCPQRLPSGRSIAGLQAARPLTSNGPDPAIACRP